MVLTIIGPIWVDPRNLSLFNNIDKSIKLFKHAFEMLFKIGVFLNGFHVKKPKCVFNCRKMNEFIVLIIECFLIV